MTLFVIFQMSLHRSPNLLMLVMEIKSTHFTTIGIGLVKFEKVPKSVTRGTFSST